MLSRVFCALSFDMSYSADVIKMAANYVRQWLKQLECFHETYSSVG